MKSVPCVFGLFISLISLAHAQDGLYPKLDFFKFESRGMGCPKGSVFNEATNKEGLTILKVQTEAFEVESSSAVARKNCSISVPVEIPPGHRLSVRRASMIGLINVQKGAQAVLNLEAFTAGASGKKVASINKADREGIKTRVEPIGYDIFVSECARAGRTSPLLRINESIVVSPSGSTGLTSAKTGELKLVLALETCD